MTKTLILLLLDESGSMAEKMLNTITSFNKFIDEQKEVIEDKGRMILIKFNDEFKTIENCTDIKDVKDLDEKNYNPDGRTALYDAILHGFMMANSNKFVDEKVIFIIITDGQENASKYAQLYHIRDIITNNKRKPDWKFIYIGVKPDEWSKGTGMDVADCVAFNNRAPDQSIGTLSTNVSQMRGDHNLFDQNQSQFNFGAPNLPHTIGELDRSNQLERLFTGE